MTTTAPSALLVVRLCDVDPGGVSRNVTEGVVHLTGGTGRPGVQVVDVALHPTAHVFRRGHRLRVHLAPGAHPRVAAPERGPGGPAPRPDAPEGYRLTVHDGPGRHPTLTVPRTAVHDTAG